MEKALELLKEDLPQVEAQFREDLASDVLLIRKVGEYLLGSGGKPMDAVTEAAVDDIINKLFR